MAIERTLSIIKPDAVAKNVIGQIYQRFEAAGLTIVASGMMQLSESKAGGGRNCQEPRAHGCDQPPGGRRGHYQGRFCGDH